MSLTNRVTIQELLQRAKKFGPECLSDHELLTVILGERFAEKKTSAGKCEWTSYSDLRQLKYLSDEEWALLLKGKGDIPYAKVLCEFAARVERRPKLILGRIYSSHEIGEQMIDEVGMFEQEVLVVILLDTKNQVLARQIIFKGTLNAATVHPREIFKFALRYSAARLMIVHNHPSGITTPSENDLNLTRRLLKGSELLGIALLDHIIVGATSYFSMREEKVLS
ncbi:RadC family protein [Liquorilactobacillus capillatus]|uniref:DNA repair protein n=1 Tax=Liquorilactobacillus capillatus DSM 19910 TaxID=1423731 RepID=A0A0R1M6R6_9LACO|nr:DNA repair protein RadC [Liquorilactobacillus capillatus]KRL00091.1 DNA repair protein [Liquorilactobacillus capillatus DSM 19910]